MSVTPIQARHIAFQESGKGLSCITAIATFLILASLIVMVSAGLCASATGVNVMRQVILPGILPGILGILLSLPFILTSVKRSEVRKEERETMMKDLEKEMDVVLTIKGKEESLDPPGPAEVDEFMIDLRSATKSDELLKKYPTAFSYNKQLLDAVKMQPLDKRETDLVDAALKKNEEKREEADAKAQGEYIEKHFFDPTPDSLDYNMRLCTDFKRRMPEKKAERTKDQEALTQALDQALKIHVEKRKDPSGKKKKAKRI